MRCSIYVVGEKMPKWCVLACEAYLQRLSHSLKCNVIEIATSLRQKSTSIEQCKESEGNKILSKISAQDHVIALEVKGRTLDTITLSKEIAHWQQYGQDVAFMIGGPDGLSKACIERSNTQWSLSSLTLPHALARVVLLEQLYRGISILNNHPYHRA